jgi:simple sugar transport system substrate-binding protein
MLDDPRRSGTARRGHRLLRHSAGALAAAATIAVAAAACGSSSSSSSQSAGSSTHASVTIQQAASGAGLAGGSSIAGKTVLWNYVADAGDTTGLPLLNGAKAAAALTGLKLDVEYGNDQDSTMETEIRTAIAKGEAGFAISVPDAALNSAVCAASKTGAPVVTFNNNGTTGAASNCVASFIGQNFVASGDLIASYMIQRGLIKRGDHVFCPVELPQDVYAVQRRQGVDQALSSLGITCDELGTGTDLGPARSTLVQYLLGHRNTNAIIALGGTPLAVTEAAIKQVGLHIPVGGFDLSYPQIVSGLKDGTIVASVNQELYAQGFYSVMELALDLKYGIPPQNINTSENALVTQQNVGTFASLVPDFQ